MIDWLAVTLMWLATVIGPGDADLECVQLGHLDAQRAIAFLHDDEQALAAVYADDTLRQHDVDQLRSWRERDLRLRGMAQQRESCQVKERSADTVRLTVVDRLGPTWVEDASGRRRPLPADGATRRTVELSRTDDGWRISGSW